MASYKIYNLDRFNCVPHLALDTTHDLGIVVDQDQTEPHPITGELQAKEVYRGKIPQCVAWVQHETNFLGNNA